MRRRGGVRSPPETGRTRARACSRGDSPGPASAAWSPRVLHRQRNGEAQPFRSQILLACPSLRTLVHPMMRRAFHESCGLALDVRRSHRARQRSRRVGCLWQCDVLLRCLDHRWGTGTTSMHRTERTDANAAQGTRSSRLSHPRWKATGAAPVLILAMLLVAGGSLRAQNLGDTPPYGGGSPPPDGGNQAPMSEQEESPNLGAMHEMPEQMAPGAPPQMAPGGPPQMAPDGTVAPPPATAPDETAAPPPAAPATVPAPASPPPPAAGIHTPP